MLMTACSDDFGFADTLNENGKKTPIDVAALLDAGGATKTRAADMEFANGDKLLSYLRHVTWNGETSGERTIVSADHAPRLVTLEVTGSMETYEDGDIYPIGLKDKDETSLGLTSLNTKQTDNLTASYKVGDETINGLYWDNFSIGAKGDATDLRTEGHFLQSFYGYCYNGGTPTAALTETSGIICWEVQTNQKDDTKTAFQHSDLLWSAEQNPVAYAHTENNHGTLVLPYTHAMSKVTISITVGEGFEDDFKLTDASIVLHNMFTSCRCCAPTYTLDNKGNSTDVTMWQGSDATVKKCTYEAIVVPSILSIGNDIATISPVNGNTYTIPVTAAMLQEATLDNGGKGWGAQLLETEKENIANGTAQAKPRKVKTIDPGKGYEMKSGVNYVLDVTLNKQGITVTALIKDWNNVYATGIGEIYFNADIRSTDKANEIDIDGAQFNLWRLEANDGNAEAGERTNSTYGIKTTTATFDNDNDDDETEDSWVCDPRIYWQDYNTSYYFRALAKYQGGNYVPFNGEDANHNATTDFNAYQGSDVVWATTAKHVGYESNGNIHKYDAGAAISPRSGEVPLAFEHAMSKITINLATGTGNDKVDLSGAKLSLTHNYDKATISLEDGGMTGHGYSYKTDGNIYSFKDLLAANGSGEGEKVSNYIVVPQDLTMTYNADGTTDEERKSGVIYYQEEELENVNGKTYVRTSLKANYYTAEERKEHNAELSGAVTVGDIKTPAVLYTFAEYNKPSLDYKSDQSLFIPISSEEEYKKLSEKTRTIPAVLYTYEEFITQEGKEEYTEAQFNALSDAEKTKVAARTIPYSDYTSQKYHLPITQTEFTSLNDASKVKTPAVYHTTETATAYNETLDDAWTPQTVKSYEVTDSSKPATTDTVKETTGTDNVIRLHIALKDGTTYSIPMSECIDDNSHLKIQEWERGNHYVYTITINKEKVTLRALIQNWKESTGSGEATLEW